MEEKIEHELMQQSASISDDLNTFGSIKGFENTCRMAKALATSTIVPKEYQNNIGNCLIALDVSTRVGLSPIMVMQNLYVVNGRPAWGSQSISALINTSGKYSKPIQYKLEGSGDDLSCYAYTEDLQGNVLEGPRITMKMAKDEGWVSKSGSKWKTMPEVMIRYRAVSFFGRLHCSELLLGIYTADEASEMEPATVIETTHEEIKQEIKEKANREVIDIEPNHVKQDKPINQPNPINEEFEEPSF